MAIKRKPYEVSDRLLIGQRVFIYVMVCGEFIKVGITADVERRLMDVQICNPHLVELASAVEVRHEVAAEAEYLSHLGLQELHVRGEWFRCNPVHATETVRFAVSKAEAGWSCGKNARKQLAEMRASLKLANDLRDEFLRSQRHPHLRVVGD